MESSIRDYIVTLREADIDESMQLIMLEANRTIEGTPYAAKFREGKVGKKWYYGFLDRCDLYTDHAKPIEDARAMWGHSENSRKQYEVWAALFCKAGLADPNANYDPTARPGDPRCQPIIWRPGAEDHVASWDETDVRADQTKKGRKQKGVRFAEPGTRRGHGQKCGRGTKEDAKTGWVRSVKERKDGPVDSGEVFAVKGGTKMSFCGGSLMNGKQLPTLVIASKKLDVTKIDLEKYAPKCDLVDSSGRRLVSRFIDTPSGGMEQDTNIDYVKTILTPSMGGKRKHESDPSNVQCCDGLGQHICYKVLKACKEDAQEIALRFSHGSQMNQKEDFINYAQFKPAFEANKSALQKERVDIVIKAAASKVPPVKPDTKDMQAAATLSDEDVLKCALEPWAAAFSVANNKKGWQEEGIYPLFDRRLYWKLVDKEAGKTMTESRTLTAEANPKTLVAYGLRPAEGETTAASTALALPEEDLLNEEDIKAEARQQADSILAGDQAAPETLPRLVAGDAFKLKGSATGREYKIMARAKEIVREVAQHLPTRGALEEDGRAQGDTQE